MVWVACSASSRALRIRSWCGDLLQTGSALLASWRDARPADCRLRLRDRRFLPDGLALIVATGLEAHPPVVQAAIPIARADGVIEAFAHLFFGSVEAIGAGALGIDRRSEHQQERQGGQQPSVHDGTSRANSLRHSPHDFNHSVGLCVTAVGQQAGACKQSGQGRTLPARAARTDSG